MAATSNSTISRGRIKRSLIFLSHTLHREPYFRTTGNQDPRVAVRHDHGGARKSQSEEFVSSTAVGFKVFAVELLILLINEKSRSCVSICCSFKVVLSTPFDAAKFFTRVSDNKVNKSRRLLSRIRHIICEPRSKSWLSACGKFAEN